MADSHRTARVGERLRDELARALRQDLRDPRVERVVISRAEVTGDLQLATVLFRLLPDASGAEPDAAARKQALAGLNAASGKLRSLLARPLGLRRVIELRFRFDEGLDASERVEQILHEIEGEKKA